MTTPTTAARSRKPAEPKPDPTPKPARRPQNATTPAPAPKPATGPRGELLGRMGAILEKPAGYVVVLPFREFETAKAGAEVGQLGTEPRWVTRCVAHGTVHPAANGTEAERAGARKARAQWCAKSAKVAR